MLNDTTTHEDSVLEPKTDVDPTPNKGQGDDVQKDTVDDAQKSHNKFAMKTNEKLNKMSQSLADTNRLTALMMKGLTAQEIKDQDPELAERLSEQEHYSEFFSVSDPEKHTQKGNAKDEIRELEVKQAIGELIIDGKRLGLSDRKLLRDNAKFQKHLNAFMNAGFDVEEAVHKSFKETYPSKSSSVETSFLSTPSETTVQKKETEEDKLKKKFNDPSTYPPSFRKAMKKN